MYLQTKEIVQYISALKTPTNKWHASDKLRKLEELKFSVSKVAFGFFGCNNHHFV